MTSKTRFSAVSMLALLCATPALAADLPSQKAPIAPPPPAFTWTGFYIGMSFAHTWTGSDPMNLSTVNVFDNTLGSRFGTASMLGATNTVGARLNGFLSGVQAGYNWQFSDRYVVGLEADVTGAGVRGGGGFFNGAAGDPTGVAVTGVKLNRSLEYLGTVRGRLGYAVTPNILAYVTGGLAFGGANQSVSLLQTLTPSLTFSASTKGNQYQNLVGWTIGAGGEMALTRALSTKLEYLYYDLGNMSLSGYGLPPLAFTNVFGGATRLVDVSQAQTRINGHLLRIGLNYRFDWSVPESASGATPLFASPHFEPAPAPAFGDWRFKVMLPYMWALGPNGSLTARGTTVGADASFIDGITQTSSFPLLFAGRVEARNGPLGFFGDYAWFQARFAASSLTLRTPALDLAFALNTAARLKQTMAFGEAGVSYEVARVKHQSGSTTAVDVYAGARYAYVGVDLRLDLFGAANSELLGIQTINGATVARSGGIRWVDPLVGIGFRHQLSPTDEFQLRGDIGGFGVGSNFSWQGYAGYNHDFDYAGLKFTTTLGYRALSIDYSSGWGRWQNGVNAIFHGPLTGVALRF